MKFLPMALLSALCLAGCTQPQSDLEYYNKIVKEISSENYYGRSGYNNGDVKTAKFIIGELMANGIKPIPQEIRLNNELKVAYPPMKSEVHPYDAGRWADGTPEELAYLQNFCYPMNVYRGAMEFSVDGVKYEPTVDFVLKEFSPSCKGDFEVAYMDDRYYTVDGFCKHLNSGKYKNKFVVVDYDRVYDTMGGSSLELYKTYLLPLNNVGGIIFTKKNSIPAFKSRNHYLTKMPALWVKDTFPKDAKMISINVESEKIEKHDAHNVIAYIEGTKVKDTCLMFIGHYDHLGLMGKDNMFPGANDNASGVAMVLTLAKYYSKHRPEYSSVFIFFDGEEENLLGSFYYAENPLLPLDKIKYIVDFDMIGDTGDVLLCQLPESAEKGLDLFKTLNAKAKAPFKEIRREPINDDSDNYPFALKNIPVIYFMFEGDYNKHYHTPRDTYENSSSENFQRLFDMTLKFAQEI